MNNIKNIIIKILQNNYSHEELEFLFKEYCCTEYNKDLKETKELFKILKHTSVFSIYINIILKYYSKKLNIIVLYSKEGNIINFY